ncbi:hypothetical protein, partial [Acidithiobacillus sp.]|uniref:hypothetical protein n=1 Tax=Acidithiobacillus sp. TaxID=1872118 RepID=UPI003D064788
MNAVIQSSAHPLVVLERNTLITHALLDRLSAYTGSIFGASDLHCCRIALIAQRLPPVLFNPPDTFRHNTPFTDFFSSAR